MPSQADLHRAGGIHLTLISQISAPMGCGFLCPQKMIHFCKDICMGIKMQKRDRLPTGQLAIAKRLYNAACDGMIAADGNRAHTGLVDICIKISDALDTIFIIICPRKRHITGIYDIGAAPGVNLKINMGASLHSRYIAHRTRP